MPEIRAAIAAGRVPSTATSCAERGNVRVIKAAIDPVWYLPGIAERFGVERDRAAPRAVRADRRHVSRAGRRGRDLKVFLPPIGGTTIYCFGDPPKLGDGKTPLACRVHDECNGSDVFGSDICTCRPYLAHGIEIVHRDGAGGRRRPRGLQSQGRPRARRGDQVPGLQRAQAAEGRRSAGGLFPSHRVRRRRRGHALPGADAGRAALARHHAHRPLRLDERHEVRRAHRARASRSTSACRFPTISSRATPASRSRPRSRPAISPATAARATRHDGRAGLDE